MVTVKPNRGYVSRPFHLYAPTKEEVDALVKTMQDEVGIPLGAEFTETLRRMVLLMRKQIDIQKTIPKQGAQEEELRQLQNAVNKLDKILSQEGISQPLWSRLTNLMITHNLGGGSDPIYGLRIHMNNLLVICEQLKNEFEEGGEKPITLAQFRDIMAEELARALNTAGYTPTVTRGGKFEKCFEAFMKSLSCTVEGRKIEARDLEEPYAVVVRAIRNYSTKPAYTLLTVKKLPGLTG